MNNKDRKSLHLTIQYFNIWTEQGRSFTTGIFDKQQLKKNKANNYDLGFGKLLYIFNQWMVKRIEIDRYKHKL